LSPLQASLDVLMRFGAVMLRSGDTPCSEAMGLLVTASPSGWLRTSPSVA
jgi:hypothetical protein